MALIYEPQDAFNQPAGVFGNEFFEVTCDPHESLFAYDNLFELPDATITASSEDTANLYFKENAYDWLVCDSWKPTAGGLQFINADLAVNKTVNYIALYGYDFDDGFFLFQYNDGGSITNAVTLTANEIAAYNGAPIVLTFPDVSSDQFRIVTSSTNAPTISVMAAGEATSIITGLRTGFASPHNGEQYKQTNNISQGANYIGSSVVKKTIRTRVRFDHVDYDWVRNTWRPFVRHYERKPFFFKWSNNRYSDEAAFCWSNINNSLPSFSTTNLNAINFQFESLIS